MTSVLEICYDFCREMLNILTSFCVIKDQNCVQQNQRRHGNIQDRNNSKQTLREQCATSRRSAYSRAQSFSRKGARNHSARVCLMAALFRKLALEALEKPLLN
jgi:hypothetical protein